MTTFISLCIFFCASLSFSVYAADKHRNKWYEIEIIVFSQDMESGFGTEIWQDKPGSPNIKNAAEVYSLVELMFEDYPENLSQSFVEPMLDPENKNTLQQYVRRIKNSAKYRLLIHRSWRQTLSRKKVYLSDNPNTDPVLVNAVSASNNGIKNKQGTEDLLLQVSMKEERDFSRPLTQLPSLMSEFDQIQDFDSVRDIPKSIDVPLSYEGPPQHLIYGTFMLSKGRHMHLDADFLYRGEPYIPLNQERSIEETFPMANQNTKKSTHKNADSEKLTDKTTLLETSEFTLGEDPPRVGFRIKESKRVRLKRVYYIDHPLFGIIVRIIRYKPPLPSS